MVLKSRDYVFKMSIFKKLSIVLYIVHCMVKSPCCSGGKSVNNCTNAKVSDRWIYSIMRHSRRFSSTEAPNAV